MSWEPGYPSNFSSDGDRTNKVLQNHINEFTRLYNIITDLFDNVNGHKHDGTVDGGPLIANTANATHADSTTKLDSPRSITIAGAVSGTNTFDGTSNITINTTPNNNIVKSDGNHDVEMSWGNSEIIARVDTIFFHMFFDGGHSFTTNGFQKFSNGLIIQWGVAIQTGQTTSVTMPIYFPTTPLFICTNIQSASMSAPGAAFTNNSTFQVTRDSAVENLPFYWFAIGH